MYLVILVNNLAVKIHPVGTISRKGPAHNLQCALRIIKDTASYVLGILRDYTPNSGQNVGEDIVRALWRHKESGRNVQAIRKHFGE